MIQKSHTNNMHIAKIMVYENTSTDSWVIDMVRWMLKGCPRCAGDMLVDSDEDGWYAKCMQCSYRSELEKTAESGKQRVKNDEEPAPMRKPESRSV